MARARRDVGRSVAGAAEHRAAARSIVLVALTAIAYFTLFPFDFHVPAGASIGSTLSGFDTTWAASYVYEDLPLNVLLFAPLGFGIGALVVGRRRRSGPDRAGATAGAVAGAVVVATVVAAVVSGVVEFVQGWSLARLASAADVLANAVGGGVGALVYVVAGDRLLALAAGAGQRLAAVITAPRLLAGCAVWVASLVALMLWSPTATALRGWDADYHLLLGNEETGDRPWEGTIEQLHVLDRSIGDDEVTAWRGRGPATLDARAVVVGHDFTDRQPLTTGTPALRWEGAGTPSAAAGGVRLGADRWLRSPEPVADVTTALGRSSEFTLLARVATDDVEQDGPARLVSISDGVFDRNLTLGQQGRDLVLRLRMPLTGTDGSDPELVVPDVFVDEAVHDVVVRYDGSIVRIGVDGATRTFELAPEAVVLLRSYPNGVEAMRPTTFRAAMFHAVPRLVLFVPVGASLAWWWRRRRHYARRSDRTGSAGVVAVAVGLSLTLALTLEVLLSSMIGPYSFRPALVVLGASAAGIGFAALAVRPGRSSESAGAAAEATRP